MAAKGYFRQDGVIYSIDARIYRNLKAWVARERCLPNLSEWPVRRLIKRPPHRIDDLGWPGKAFDRSDGRT